jgi:hypothetical protein
VSFLSQLGLSPIYLGDGISQFVFFSNRKLSGMPRFFMNFRKALLIKSSLA